MTPDEAKYYEYQIRLYSQGDESNTTELLKIGLELLLRICIQVEASLQ